nr:hypothetical protein [Anaplasma phagocytophilum]
MSGYAYSGLSSTEYKDSLCRAITTGLMPYDECLKVICEFMMELRNTSSELRGLDSAFEENVHRTEILQSAINAEIAMGAGPTVRILHYVMHKSYDMLHDCITAECNRDVALFMDPSFISCGTHLQIAKAYGILANIIAIVNCLAITVSGTFYNPLYERDADAALNANIVFSAYVSAEFSGLSRCLDSSLGSEETRRRKAILRVVRHNIELCNKVSELISPNMPFGFRHRIESCIHRLLDTVKASSAECEEMVSDSKIAQQRLAIARKALLGFQCYFKVYRNLGATRDFQGFVQGEYTCALVHAMGGLFSMYRGYSAAGNADHNVAGIIEHCLKILLALPSTRRNIGTYETRKVYADMCSVYEDLEQHLRPELLLNPGAEVKLRDSALRYLSEMMRIWEREYGRYFNAVEQTGGSPSQPSTSGLGSTSTGVESSQVSYMPSHDQGIMPDLYAQPSTSGLGSTSTGVESSQVSYMPSHDQGIMPDLYAQPSTSGLGSTSTGVGSSQVSYMPMRALERIPIPYAPCHQPSTSGLGGTAGLGQQAPYMPPHDPESMPSYSWDQPSTSGLGSTSTGVGSSQVSYMPMRALERIPIPYAPCHQPSTSGLGGTAGLGQQAPYMPPHDPESMPSYSWDQPSTSAEASSELQEAQVSPHRSRTPSNDDLEPPSKRSRSA